MYSIYIYILCTLFFHIVNLTMSLRWNSKLSVLHNIHTICNAASNKAYTLGKWCESSQYVKMCVAGAPKWVYVKRQWKI